ncbi:MAG: phage portal protein, partial [Dermatophilaceae bacterium]|nr:phage portal protein [Dermatophilaceae bacterium]
RVSWFHPDSVYPQIISGEVIWYVHGQQWDQPAMFVHRRVNPIAGRLLGMSVVERHAMQIGTSLAAGQFGSQWFADGGHPSGLLVNQSDITQEQAATVKARWTSLFKGTREPAVLGKGWDWKPIQITPNESQFLETQRFTEAQCARMFGPAVAETLGYETGGSMTYANVVDRRSDLLTFSLNKWLRRAERVLTALLPAPQYARFNRDALLQSTTLARYEAHSKALEDRWRTVNEVRDMEELPPVAWGGVPNEKTPNQPGSAQQ